MSFNIDKAKNGYIIYNYDSNETWVYGNFLSMIVGLAELFGEQVQVTNNPKTGIPGATLNTPPPMYEVLPDDQ